jgi:hypothetical protein
MYYATVIPKFFVLIDDQDLASCKDEFIKSGIELQINEQRSTVQMAALQSLIDFVIQPESILAISSGIVSAAAYDIFKNAIYRLYSAISPRIMGTRNFSKISMKCGNDTLVISAKLSKKQINKAIDSFTDIVKTKTITQNSAPIWMYVMRETGELVNSQNGMDAVIQAIKADENS